MLGLIRTSCTSLTRGARAQAQVVQYAGRSMSTQSSSILDRAHGLNEDQRMLLDMADGFAEKELKPYAAEWDRTE
ncbi:hypothetical protein SARC_16372, partial [Sphaeroforma arctica JP610]